MAQKKQILINSSVLCAVIVGLFLLAEITFRFIYDSDRKLSTEIIWEAQNAGRATDESMFTEFGGFQFREEKIPDDILEDKWVRVLFLGDSFTYGTGINNNESRFSNIVEKELNEEFFDNQAGQRLHIFNASKSSSNPSHWYGTFKTLEPMYRPRHVFAIFFLRDGAPLGTSLKFNAQIIEPIQQKFARMPLYRHSAFLRFFYDRFAWMEYTDTFKEMMISSYLGTAKQRSKWLFEQRFLAMLADECREKGMSFHLVIFPMLFDLEDYKFYGVENEIIRFAESDSIPVFSLTPGFIGEEDSELWVASNDQHPNERGHRIAATTLLPFMADVCGFNFKH